MDTQAARAARIMTVGKETAMHKLRPHQLHPLLHNSLVLPSPQALVQPRKPSPISPNLLQELIDAPGELDEIPLSVCLIVPKLTEVPVDTRAMLDRVLHNATQRLKQRPLSHKDVTCSTITKNDGTFVASLTFKLTSTATVGYGPKSDDAQKRACECMLAQLDDEPIPEECPRVVFAEEVAEGPSIPTQSNATSLTNFLVEQSRLALKQDLADAQQKPPSRDAQLHIDGEHFHTIIMSRPSTWTSFDELKRTLRRVDLTLAPEDNILGQRPFTEAEVKGKVVVLLKGTWEPNQKGSFNVKCNHAAEGGAVGVIMINTQEGLFDIKPRMGIVAPTIPCVTISRESGDELMQKLGQGPLVLSKAFRGDHVVELLRGSRNGDHTVGAPSLAINKGKAYFEVAIESLENLKLRVGVAGMNFVSGGGQFVGDVHSVGVDGFDGKMLLMGAEKPIEQMWDDSLADGPFVVGVCVDFGFQAIIITLNGDQVAEFPVSTNDNTEFFFPAVTLNGKARFRFAEPWSCPPKSPVQPWAQHLNLRPVRTYERPQVVPVKPPAPAAPISPAEEAPAVVKDEVSVKRDRTPSRPRERSRSRSRDRRRDRDRRDDRDRDDRRRDDRGRDRSRRRRR